MNKVCEGRKDATIADRQDTQFFLGNNNFLYFDRLPRNYFQ